MFTAEQSYELALLCICIYREARGESQEAKYGVGWCIRNRAEKPGKMWYGDDYPSVILKPFQFSSFNANDPNATKFPLPHDPSFGPCLMAAKRVYEGTVADPTLNATYYHDDSIAPPPWAAQMTKTVQIGRLHFYREP